MKKMLNLFVLHTRGCLFLLGIIFYIIQTGCVVYVPNVINTPLLSQKGEVQVNLNLGESGFDPQLSGAVSDHVGIMLNGSFRLNSENSTYSEEHNFVEAGAGYFTKFEGAGRFEVFGGVGIGNLKASNVEFWTTGPEIDVKTLRFFLQPDVGVRTTYFDGGFATRFALLDLDFGDKTTTKLFIEPAITLKGGSKNIKAVLQFGYSIPTGNSYDDFYDPLLLSIGIQGTFGRKNNQENKKPAL